MSTRVNKLPIFIFGSGNRVSGEGGSVNKRGELDINLRANARAAS